MRTIKIDVSPPLPATEKEMRERIDELTEAGEAIRQELNRIIGSGMPIGPVPFNDCLRCGHHWQKKRWVAIRPKRCPNCHSTYWFRPRIYEEKKREPIMSRKKSELFTEQFSEVKTDGFAPPPRAPMSLKERLALQQPAAETESDAPLVTQLDAPVNYAILTAPLEGPATDGADSKSNESEEVQESLSDA
jgi:predicted Zn-ribbon and HTH transcriptional regulator